MIPLPIRPEIRLDYMLNQLWRITLDHPPDPWQRNRPDRTQLSIVLQVNVVQFGTGDRGHEEHVSKEGNGAFGFFEVVTSTGSDGVGTVLVSEERNESCKKFEFVGG